MHEFLKLEAHTCRVILASLLLFIPSVVISKGTQEEAQETEEPAPYQVQCAEGGSECKVDKTTYVGWRTYHAVCHVCHSQDAIGSTFAPSLVERLEGMNKERFMEVVLDGYTGQTGVMPGWKQDPNVLPKVENLWSYLRARSDGALGTGKPKKLPTK